MTTPFTINEGEAVALLIRLEQGDGKIGGLHLHEAV